MPRYQCSRTAVPFHHVGRIADYSHAFSVAQVPTVDHYAISAMICQDAPFDRLPPLWGHPTLCRCCLLVLLFWNADQAFGDVR